MTRSDHWLPSALNAIGNTPLVELARVTRHLDGRVLAKLEYLNPGSSKKDRIALQIIQDAEGEGATVAQREHLLRNLLGRLAGVPRFTQLDEIRVLGKSAGIEVKRNSMLVAHGG